MKFTVRTFGLLCLVALATALPGCGATLQTIKVPVQVECKEDIPERPTMPTEQFTVKPSVDQFVQAAQVEILRRDGYEKRLDAALRACTAPIVSSPKP